jgi:hypothetical protein
MGNSTIVKDPHSEEIPYDDQKIPTNLGTSVQDALDNLYKKVNVSASPGFTWGRSGTNPGGTWLLNDTVPSNKSGREVFLYNSVIEKVYVANQDANSIKIGVYYHNGDSVGLTLLGTVTTGAVRSQDFTVSYSVPKGVQLALKIENNTPNGAKEPVIGILMVGTLTP